MSPSRAWLLVSSKVYYTINREETFNVANAAEASINLSNSNCLYTLTFSSDVYNVQNFFVDGSTIYTTQKDSSGNVKICKFLIDTVSGKTKVTKTNEEMWIAGAGHGQTLEVYTYNKKTYLLCSLKKYDDGKNIWSVQIGRVVFKPNTKSTMASYSDFERFSALSYSNGDMSVKSFGTIKRVDAALSSDNSTLLIWKRNTDDKNELTAYNFNYFNTELDTAKFNNNYVSLKDSDTMRQAVRFSFNDKNGSKGIPSSVQGVELSNKSSDNGLYSIYFSSGDEGLNNALKIYRFNSNGNKKSEKTITHTNFLGGKKLEIEGIHIKGSQLQFLVVESWYLNKVHNPNSNATNQYIMNVDKSLLS